MVGKRVLQGNCKLLLGTMATLTATCGEKMVCLNSFNHFFLFCPLLGAQMSL